MKIINHIQKSGAILTSLLMIFFLSCSEDFPENVESPNQVVLKSIKILNAGIDGNTIVEGTINESTKRVSFPRVDPETNVSAIRFEAEMSDGATLDSETYSFNFEEGQDANTIVIKVENAPRFREYFVTLRLNVPVFGADFEKAMVYDHSGSDNGELYPSFVSNLTRGSGFDGEHILIVTRAEGGSHLLSVDDIRNDRVAPIPLNLTGVSGGTFPVNVGAQVHGHTYIANLSGLYGMKIYHWANPDDAPDIILNVDPASIPGAGARHGDNMSVNLDEQGNGFIYFGDNAVTEIMQLSVTNFTEISEIKILPTQTGVSFCMTMNRVENTDDYLLTGYDAPIMLTSSEATVAYRMNESTLPKQGADARIVTFNSERYLLFTISPRYSDNPVLYVYDITRGATTAEALAIFEEESRTPLLQYSLGGSANSAPATQTGYHILKDDEGEDASLLIYTASNNAGFVMLEIPKKVLED